MRRDKSGIWPFIIFCAALFSIIWERVVLESVVTPINDRLVTEIGPLPSWLAELAAYSVNFALSLIFLLSFAAAVRFHYRSAAYKPRLKILFNPDDKEIGEKFCHDEQTANWNGSPNPGVGRVIQIGLKNSSASAVSRCKLNVIRIEDKRGKRIERINDALMPVVHSDAELAAGEICYYQIAVSNSHLTDHIHFQNSIFPDSRVPKLALPLRIKLQATCREGVGDIAEIELGMGEKDQIQAKLVNQRLSR